MNEWSLSELVRVRESKRHRRAHKVDTRWDDLEFASLLAASQTTGLTKSGFIRALVLGNPGPRTQRIPSFDALALAKATAALNRVHNNLNQVARILNSAGADLTAEECLLAISDVRDAVAGILNVVGREVRS